jgi:hypothetical protein
MKDSEVLPGKMDINLFNGTLGDFNQALGVTVPEKKEVAAVDTPKDIANPSGPVIVTKPTEPSETSKPSDPVITKPTESTDASKPSEPVIVTNRVSRRWAPEAVSCRAK